MQHHPCTPGDSPTLQTHAHQVDVTNEETDASGKPIDLTGVGTRVVIGGSPLDWMGSPAGGIAYLGGFGDKYLQPCFVFPYHDALVGRPKRVWEAASHEIGEWGCRHMPSTLVPAQLPNTLPRRSQGTRLASPTTDRCLAPSRTMAATTVGE